MDFDFNFHEMVEEFLNEYEFEFRYDEDEDVYLTGVTFDEVGNVTFLIMNGGSKVNIIGEFDYELENDMVYYRASDFVHRFNAMDCVATLFIDPDTKKVYCKRSVQMLNIVDPDFFFSKDFFRLNLEMDMFGKALHGVFSGVISDMEAIALVEQAIEQYNNEMYEESEKFMN